MTPLRVPATLPVMIESEVAVYLRNHLGPVLVWPFVLTSLRRAGNQDELLPFAFRANRRYFYAVSDVLRFVEKFSAENPDAKPGVETETLLAGDVAPTHRKTRIRYKIAGLLAPTPKAAPATLH